MVSQNKEKPEVHRSSGPAVDRHSAPGLSLSAKQSGRLAARSLLLDAFEQFKSGRSDRAMLAAFVYAFDGGLVDLPGWTRPLIKSLSVKNLKRWLADRRAGRNTSLTGARRNGGTTIFDRSREAADWLIGAHIERPHLSFTQLGLLLAVEFPAGLPDQSGLLMPRPSVKTVERFIKRWESDPMNRLAMTSLVDPDRYRASMRFAGGDASAGIVRLNQRWQIDASPADVMCLDGRHSIYVVIDVFSRRMMALVSPTPRTAAALLLIKRACVAWGCPEVLVTDNGSDFKSLHFVDAIRRLSVQLVATAPYSPEKKAFVERGIGTIQRGFMAMQPGFKGHNVAQAAQIRARHAFAARRGETDDALFSVALTGGDLQDRLDAWLTNVYALTPHRGIGTTPQVRALQGAEAHPPRFAQESAIGVLLMPPPKDGLTRIVTKKGVSVGGLDYWFDGLLTGQRVQVRLDPDELGQIYLYTDTDPWVFLGVAQNPDVMGIDRAALTARVRASQDNMVRDHRAEQRKQRRAADLPAVVSRLSGATLAPPASADGPPDRVEIAIADAIEGVKPKRVVKPVTEEEREDHKRFVEEFNAAREQRKAEETPRVRYARWKELGALIRSGAEISSDSRRWHDTYSKTPECLGRQLVEESFGQ